MKISELEPNTPGMDEVGEKLRVEEGTVNLRGLRLNPFDTADICVTLRADRAGEYVLQPRICYLDERGRYQQYQPQPVAIVAREASGGAGEKEKPEAPKVEYEFKAKQAKEVFDCLVDGFIEDYAIKRLYSELAGWRTLTAVAEMARVPISTLYGRRIRRSHSRAVVQGVS